MSRRTFYIAIAIVTLLGTFLRLQDLDAKPMHGDEANQAVKAGVLFDTGEYAYDPFEHHGPTLYYGVLPLLWLSGANSAAASEETTYRLLPALAGILLIIVTACFSIVIGREAAVWAMLFTAVSHGMVYYSRYFIQETLLVLFLALLLVGIGLYVRKPGVFLAVLVGAAAALAHASKETALLYFAATAAACAAAWMLAKAQRPTEVCLTRTLRWIRWRDLALAFLAALVVFLALYSSFGSHPRGIADAFRAYATYLGRAEGHGSTAMHEKPWHYYLQVLLYTHREAGPRWSEGFFMALAFIGAGVVFAGRKPQAVAQAPLALTYAPYALVFYAIIGFVGFSLIPYKTPWNLLPFYQPLLLVAGIGAASITRGRWVRGGFPMRTALRVAAGILLLAGVLFSVRQTWLGTTVYAADTRNPYVYAHTSTALVRLVQRVDELAALAGGAGEVRIDIFKPDGDYWPLPWYLRGYGAVAYWRALPERISAPLLITEPSLAEEVLRRAGDRQYQSQFYSLRPGVNLILFVEQSLWKAFMARRTP